MNEELTNVSGEEMSDADNDLVATIQQLKNETVSKTEYERVLKQRDKAYNERNQLATALVNGQRVEDEPEECSLEELVTNVTSVSRFPNQPSLTTVKHLLKLRDYMISHGQDDPYLPGVGDMLKHCVEEAGDSNKRFMLEYENHTVEPLPSITRK